MSASGHVRTSIITTRPWQARFRLMIPRRDKHHRTKQRGQSQTAHKSGGRDPAVVRQTASATAMRGISACRFAFREHTTGGLRPPLLCCSANVCRRNNDFCDAQTYIRPRAAGVIPPWLLGKRTCRNVAVKSRETAGTMPTNAGAVAFVRHGWLTPAAPGCTTFVRCEMRDSQCGVAHPTKSGGRHRAVD
jgi:hypothetical protein